MLCFTVSTVLDLHFFGREGDEEDGFSWATSSRHKKLPELLKSLTYKSVLECTLIFEKPLLLKLQLLSGS